MALYTNDDNMTYDVNNHRYVLTDDGFKAYSGYSLFEKLDTESKDQELTVKFVLNRASEVVYGILLANPRNYKGALCFLAQSEVRQQVYNALCRCVSDMMAQNKDNSEEVKNQAPVISVGLQMLLEGLYGSMLGYQNYTFGEDY